MSKRLLSIFLCLFTFKIHAQDIIRLAPFGKENCYEFMTQGYRGNVVSVIADDETHYKIKMNKLAQIEWVVEDPSEAMHSMLDSGLLIGVYSRENKIYINCREKNGDLRWVKSEDGGAYSFDIIEMNAQQFVLASGDFYKTSLFCMDLNGKVIWKTTFGTSMHLANSGDVVFENEQGLLVLGEKLGIRDSLYFTQLDNNGQVLWQKRKYFITQEGGIVIYQDVEGRFIIYDPDTYKGSNYYSSSLQILMLDKSLEEISRKDYDMDYPCPLIPFTAFPYVEAIIPHMDSLVYSILSHSDEEQEVLIYTPGIEYCFYDPIRFELPNPLECRPSLYAGNHLMVERGTSDLIVAFSRYDEDGLHTRFGSFFFEGINLVTPQYKINVFASDLNCNNYGRLSFFKDWIFSHKFGSASVLEWDKPRDYIELGNIQDPKINSAIYGYDFCLDDRSDYVGGEIDYMIQPVEGAGIALNLSVSADRSEQTGKVYLKYWRYGQDWIDGTAIQISAPCGLEFADTRVNQINDTTWQLNLNILDHFVFYQEDLDFELPADSEDNLSFSAVVQPEITAPVEILRSRKFDLKNHSENSINLDLQNVNRRDTFIRQGEKILFALSYLNDGQDTVKDLRFYNALSGVNYNSFAPETSSSPVDTRRIRDGLGNSIDISVPNILLPPGHQFFATFSVDPLELNCGSKIINKVTTVVNYQHLDTSLLQIKYQGLGLEETRDTFLAVGSEFDGAIISGDTTITQFKANVNGCDTIIHYQISTSTVAIHNLEFNNVSTYPNPFTDRFKIDYDNAALIRLRIFDTSGKEIKYQINRENEVELLTTTPGIYLITAEFSNGDARWLKVLKM